MSRISYWIQQEKQNVLNVPLKCYCKCYFKRFEVMMVVRYVMMSVCQRASRSLFLPICPLVCPSVKKKPSTHFRCTSIKLLGNDYLQKTNLLKIPKSKFYSVKRDLLAKTVPIKNCFNSLLYNYIQSLLHTTACFIETLRFYFFRAFE